MAKRGRKPKNQGNKHYFGEEQEMAVIQYINSNDAFEKNRIYSTYLQKPFEKMVESIIRRYNLYTPNEESGTTFCDTLTELITKLNKDCFNPSEGKKAYSYYGTIAKNYLRNKKTTYIKETNRNPSYDEVNELISNDIHYSTDKDNGKELAISISESLIKRIEYMIENAESFCLSENEIKMGKAIIILFDNWDYVLSTDSSKKLNKSAVLLFLREQTGFKTKEIRDNMKKFKKEFLIIKNMFIS